MKLHIELLLHPIGLVLDEAAGVHGAWDGPAGNQGGGWVGGWVGGGQGLAFRFVQHVPCSVNSLTPFVNFSICSTPFFDSFKIFNPFFNLLGMFNVFQRFQHFQ